MIETDEGVYKRYLEKRGESDLLILLERHRESLALFLYGFVHNMDDAEELMMDTYAEIAAGGRFSGKCSFKTWLFSIGKKKALMFLRKKKSGFYFEETPDEGVKDEETSPLEMDIFAKERNKQLFSAMENINEEYKTILILLYFEDMSMEEASKVMGKSRKQVYNLSDRGKKALRVELERMGFEYA